MIPPCAVRNRRIYTIIKINFNMSISPNIIIYTLLFDQTALYGFKLPHGLSSNISCSRLVVVSKLKTIVCLNTNMTSLYPLLLNATVMSERYLFRRKYRYYNFFA